MSFLIKRPEKPSLRQPSNRPRIVGHVDIFATGRIGGWAVDLDDQKSSLWIDLYSSGDYISTHDANATRADLLNLGLEFIDHGFEFDCALPSTALGSVDLIARRKDTKAASTTTNLATNFINRGDLFASTSTDSDHARRPPLGQVLQRQAQLDLDGRTDVAADPFGFSLDQTLRTALSGMHTTVIAPHSINGETPFAWPHAAIVNVPVESSSEILECIGQLEAEQSCIVVDHLLQYGIDYRRTLGAAFDKLKVGGFLVLTVPSQILYERKLQLPSRLPSKFGKLYTASILLTELEEAIDPFVFRIRFTGDLDKGYAAPTLDQVPEGRSDCIAIIEKVEPPTWLDRMKGEDIPIRHSPVPTQQLKPDRQSPYVVVAPDEGQLNEILILQLDHRGDFVMGAEARRLIRDLWPDAHITLICGSWNKQDALSAGVADTVIPFDFFAEDVSAGAQVLSLEQHLDLLEQLVENHTFDLAIDLRLGSDTRPFLNRIAARMKAGFDTGDEFPWLDIRMPTINPERSSRAWQRFVPASDFHTCGDHNYLDIKVSPEDCERMNDRTIIWGPYMDLPFGQYEFVLKCGSPVRTEIRYDIAADAGETIIGGGTLKVGAFCDQILHVRLPQPVKAFEVRIYAIPGRPYPPIAFGGMQIIKRASILGLHQRENMNLLAHLVALRTQHAAVSERIMRHAAG